MDSNQNPPGTSFPAVRACIFDMDGLLIDSEDIYSLCTNAVLREYGRPDLPWSVKAQLQGRPAPEASAIFQSWAQLPITQAEYTNKVAVLQRQYFPTSKPLPGVFELLDKLTSTTTTTLSSSKVHIALASSSHRGNYNAKTSHLQHLFSMFPSDHIVLGDDPRIPCGKGKPAPDIYLLALETINHTIRQSSSGGHQTGTDIVTNNNIDIIKPSECLVFEDAVPGVEAARRAGMRVIWVPHPALLHEYHGREKLVLAGLASLTHRDRSPTTSTNVHDDCHHDHDQRIKQEPVIELQVNQEDNQHHPHRQAHILGEPGTLDDGWGEIFTTLENFPFSHYGILTTPRPT